MSVYVDLQPMPHALGHELQRRLVAILVAACLAGLAMSAWLGGNFWMPNDEMDSLVVGEP